MTRNRERNRCTRAGSARTPAEAERTTIVDVETTKDPNGVALLSHTYGFNAIPWPDGEDSGPTRPTSRQSWPMRRWRWRGAEFVVVALHWALMIIPITIPMLRP